MKLEHFTRRSSDYWESTIGHQRAELWGNPRHDSGWSAYLKRGLGHPRKHIGDFSTRRDALAAINRAIRLGDDR